MNNRELTDALKDSNLAKGKHATRATHKQIQWCINKQKTLINAFILSIVKTRARAHARTHARTHAQIWHEYASIFSADLQRHEVMCA